jgi:subtilisin family serine protease
VVRLTTVTVLTLAVWSSPLDAPTAQSAEAPSVELLIRDGHPALLDPTVEVVRPIGAGWHLALGPSWLLQSPVTASAEGRSEITSAPSIERNDSYSVAAEPLFDQQWGLENTGQEGGTPDADIDILGAWPTSEGADIVVAVIDSGVDLDHPDLVDRFWTNTGEVPDNGVDDDLNGYTDDVMGWDMIDLDATPEGVNAHGTAVAGVVAASINDVGVAGVAPKAVVMPLRACATTNCPYAAVAEAIAYAVDNDAAIINLSLGGFGYSQTLADAIGYAEAAGVPVVAAAGNFDADNDLTPYYPASLDNSNIISVAATDRNDDLAVFPSGGSHYGESTVDLAAPGAQILTTTIGGWGTWNGTSFAAPMVSGTAAMILDLTPTATPTEIRQMIMDSVDDIPSLDGRMVSGGRLNAASAISVPTNSAPVAVADTSPDIGWAPMTVAADGTGSFDPDGSIVEWAWSTDDATGDGETTTLVLTTVGVNEIELTVTDDLGATASDTTTAWVGMDFLDTQTSIFRTDVAWLSAIGATRGCNPPDDDRYCPDDQVTRGQMAAFVNRVLDLPATGTDFFVDDDDSIFEDDINRLAAAGITTGCNPPENDRFCPTDPVTRGQFAAFFRRANF